MRTNFVFDYDCSGKIDTRDQEMVKELYQVQFTAREDKAGSLQSAPRK